MRNFIWEIRKNPLRPWVLLVVICVMLLLNSYVGTNKIQRLTAAITDEYQTGFDLVYSKVEGPITLENMQWIVSEYSRLNEIIQSGQFSTEEDRANTYTGYVFQDSFLFEQLYEDAKYAFEYGSNAEKIALTAAENAQFYFPHGNTGLSERYTTMAKAFQDRKISSFYRTEGWMSYFTYEFSNLMIMLAVLIGVSTMFSLEWELGTKTLLQVTLNGNDRARKSKLLSAAVYIWGVTTIFSIQDFLRFALYYGFRGFGNPLYAISELSETILNISIGKFLVFNYAVKLLGICVFAIQILLLSAVVKSNIYAFGGGLAVLALQIVADAFCLKVSMLPLLNSAQLCAVFEGTTIGGNFVPNLYLQILIQVGIGVCCGLLLSIIDKDVFPRKRKEVGHVPTHKMAN